MFARLATAIWSFRGATIKTAIVPIFTIFLGAKKLPITSYFWDEDDQNISDKEFCTQHSIFDTKWILFQKMNLFQKSI